MMDWLSMVTGLGKAFVDHSTPYGSWLITIGCGLKRNVIRFLPPLNVTGEEMEEALDIFATAFTEVK